MKIRIEKIEIDIDEKLVDAISGAVLTLEAGRAQAMAAEREHEARGDRESRESQRSMQMDLAAMLLPLLHDLLSRSSDTELPPEASAASEGEPGAPVNDEPK